MPLVYVEITGTFEDGQGNPLSGTATFTPNTTVYAAAEPVLVADVPVRAVITGGQLTTAAGGTVQLLATDNAGLTVEGGGVFLWSVSVTVTGADADTWEFELPGNASPVDLYSTRS